MDRSPRSRKKFHRPQPRLRRDHVKFSAYFAALPRIFGRAELQAVEALQDTGPTPISDGQVLTLNATGGSVCHSRGGSISVDPGRVLLTDESVAMGSS